MAKSRLKDGFVMVAIDLFPAILSCGLSTYAQTILAEVLMQSYGPQKREIVYLIASELAERTGLDRNNARRAIRELMNAGILKVDGAGFRFVKDYESWNPPAGRLSERLGGNLLKWIRGASERLGIHKRESNNSESTQTHDKLSDESTQTHDKLSDESTQTQEIGDERVYLDSVRHLSVSLPKLSQTTVSESTQTQQKVCPPDPPIEDRAAPARPAERVRIKERNGVVVGAGEPMRAHACERETSPGCPPFPDPATSPLMAMPGGFQVTDAEAREIWELVWKAWKSQRLCNQFYEHQSWHKPESWRAAIRQLARDGTEPYGIKLVEMRAARFDANGVPEERPVTAKPTNPTQPVRPNSRIEERNRKFDERLARAERST
jgi:hypothetical protein